MFKKLIELLIGKRQSNLNKPVMCIFDFDRPCDGNRYHCKGCQYGG